MPFATLISGRAGSRSPSASDSRWTIDIELHVHDRRRLSGSKVQPRATDPGPHLFQRA
jgi:hypothetical protein